MRALALAPTSENFAAINGKLESLAAFLSRTATASGPAALRDPKLRDFLQRLPAEMARMRSLMQAPTLFYQGLETIRALHFGSYERSGNIRSLESNSATRTLIHL